MRKKSIKHVRSYVTGATPMVNSVAPITQFTHMRYKNSNTQGSSPYVVKVIFHT